MSFIILSKFEINNERSDIVICQWFTLIDNTESFLLRRNPIKSESWLLFDYNGVSCIVLIKKIYWWNIWHDYTPFLQQRQQEKESYWIVDGDPRSLKPSNTFWTYEFFFFHSLHYVLLKTLFSQASNLHW
jgi:hypothetical protein